MPTLKQSHLLPCIHRPLDNPHQNTSQRPSYWRIIADMWHTMLAESASSRYSQTVSSLFQTVIKWSWATLDVASHQLIPGLQPLAGAHPLTLHNGRIWGCQDICENGILTQLEEIPNIVWQVSSPPMPMSSSAPAKEWTKLQIQLTLSFKGK